MKRTQLFTKEEALEKTNGGRIIFEEVIGHIPTKNINSPLRPGDNIPSFQIKSKKGVYYFQDFGGKQQSGNAIDFLMYLNGWTFVEALNHIKNNYFGERVENYPILTSSPAIIEFDDMPFSDIHKEYWKKYELEQKFLNDNNVYAVKQWAINKKKQIYTDERAIFAYYAEDIDRVKILQVGEHVKPEEKWTNNVPNTYLWWQFQFKSEKCPLLFVCKSVKDALMFKRLGHCAISVQNESSKILLKHNVDIINSLSTFPVMVFGTDPQGKNASIEITKATGWKWFNTSNMLLKHGIEDPADLVAEFGSTILKKEIDKKIKLWNMT